MRNDHLQITLQTLQQGIYRSYFAKWSMSLQDAGLSKHNSCLSFILHTSVSTPRLKRIMLRSLRNRQKQDLYILEDFRLQCRNRGPWRRITVRAPSITIHNYDLQPGRPWVYIALPLMFPRWASLLTICSEHPGCGKYETEHATAIVFVKPFQNHE